MKFDGMDFKKSKALGWRNEEPGDVDGHGKELVEKPGSHVVIVRIKDCPKEEKDGRRYYVAKGVKQHVALSYSLTRMGYGPWKYHTADGYKHVPRLGSMNPGDQWKTCTVYLVHKGYVYTTCLKRKVSFEERLETASKAAVKAWAGHADYAQLALKHGTTEGKENAKAMFEAMEELKTLLKM